MIAQDSNLTGIFSLSVSIFASPSRRGCPLHAITHGHQRSYRQPSALPPNLPIMGQRYCYTTTLNLMRPISSRVRSGRFFRYMPPSRPVKPAIPQLSAFQAHQSFSISSKLERAAGIEPASEVWKTPALPLCYTRCRRGRDLNLQLDACPKASPCSAKLSYLAHPIHLLKDDYSCQHISTLPFLMWK